MCEDIVLNLNREGSEKEEGGLYPRLSHGRLFAKPKSLVRSDELLSRSRAPTPSPSEDLGAPERAAK